MSRVGFAARVTDPTVHLMTPLSPGPGSPNVLIGMLPAWRGLPAGAAAALQGPKQTADTAVKTAEAATVAAAGTPGLPAAKAAEETAKATAASAMSAAINAAVAGSMTAVGGTPDIHMCPVPMLIIPHGPGVVIDGSATVLINGLPACRMGDTILEALGPPNKIVMGLPTVWIGDLKGGGGGGGAPGVTPPGGAPGVDPPDTFGKAIKIDGDAAFRAKTLAALAEIAKTPSGAKMLQDLEATGKTVTIHQTAGGNEAGPKDMANANRKADGTPGKGSDGDVWFNPDNNSIGPEPWQTRPPSVGLAHELIHTTHYAKGERSPNLVQNDSKPDPADPTKFQQSKEEEVRTAGIPPYDKEPYSENTIRSEMDPPQPQRPYY